MKLKNFELPEYNKLSAEEILKDVENYPNGSVFIDENGEVFMVFGEEYYLVPDNYCTFDDVRVLCCLSDTSVTFSSINFRGDCRYEGSFVFYCSEDNIEVEKK